MSDSALQAQYGRWSRDMQFLLSAAARLPAPDRADTLRQYFAATYPDDPDSELNQARLLACSAYLLEHQQEFVAEHHARPLQDGCWLSTHLDVALWRQFARLSWPSLGRDIPISTVLALAEEQQRLHPDA